MYQKMLVPLDGSKLAECVLPHVEALATGCRVTEVILFRVCQPPTIRADYPENMPVSWEEHVEQMTAHQQQQCGVYLEQVAAALRDRGLCVTCVSKLGDASQEIVDFAEKNEVDLVVMASHGRSGPGRWAYGSVSDKVFRSTCVPVLMVRAPGCMPGL